MPTMAPGIELATRLQPFLIRLGDIIVVIVFVLAVLIAIATVAYILGREWRWWRQVEEAPRPAQTQRE